MMIKPGINTLASCVDSRYTLVTMAAKRARMIGETGSGLVSCDSKKPVSIAVAEIAAGKVGYVRNDNKKPTLNGDYSSYIKTSMSSPLIDENGKIVEQQF